MSELLKFAQIYGISWLCHISWMSGGIFKWYACLYHVSWVLDLISNLGMIDVIFPLIGLLRRGNLSLHDGKWWSTILPANQTWRLENPYMIFPSLETPSSLGDFQLPAIFDDTRHGLRVGCIRNHWLVWKSCIHVYPKINCWTHWVQLWPLTVIYIFLKKTPQTKFIYAYIYIYICAHHYKPV